jgi:ATP-dependent Clp protease, protease subunit
MKRRLNEILIRHSGRSMDEIERDTDRDKFMEADEAVKYGLVDRLLEHMEPGIAGQAKPAES